MVRAAGFGAGASWVFPPPISKADAEQEFGATISESAWHDIREAFRLHGIRLNDLQGTRDNENKNDPCGWYKRKLDAENGIKAALSGLMKINRDFLVEAEENVSLKQSGGVESYDGPQRLDKVMDEILFLSWLMREAEPISQEIPTKAQSRKQLAFDVFNVLKSSGAKCSNGWEMEQGEPSHADLTGFEKLVELLEIHQGETPRATSKWLREALAQKG